ncbi:hypothetical protein A3715_20180 [Oleiphilus sp. HI0009]|nr:hypothetical protein A3715_15285 [Oleiphilus sp. HI0009]KZX78334.1 hypothetical protein A3715_20180 [Oleiphilus sp. HI0009]
MKIHSKNGLEYWYERFGEFGEWRYKPEGKKIEITIPAGKRQKLRKPEAEMFINDKEAALAHYESKVEELADIKKAKARLDDAESRLISAENSIGSLKGSNPKSQLRQIEDAKTNVTNAKMQLRFAEKLNKELAEEKNKSHLS